MLYGWGRNDEYQLGINSTDDEAMPVKIGMSVLTYKLYRPILNQYNLQIP